MGALKRGGQPKSSLSASRAPNINDDASKGYVKNSSWYFVDDNKFYVCVSNVIDAAEWILINTGSASPLEANVVAMTNESEKTIAHNLGRNPIVFVLDSDGSQIEVGITHSSLNEFTVYGQPNITGSVIYY